MNRPIITDISAAIARQRQDKKALREAMGMTTQRPDHDSKRLTKAQTQAVREYVLEELHACYRAVQDKRREFPAWARGYDSALSAIETRISLFKDGRPCTCKPGAECTERCDRKKMETSSFRKFLEI